MIKNGWDSITQLDLWDYMRKDCLSYQLCQDAEIWVITRKMQELGYYGHSGHSFGWTMRQLQQIAQKGEFSYMQQWTRT